MLELGLIALLILLVIKGMINENRRHKQGSELNDQLLSLRLFAKMAIVGFTTHYHRRYDLHLHDVLDISVFTNSNTPVHTLTLDVNASLNGLTVDTIIIHSSNINLHSTLSRFASKTKVINTVIKELHDGLLGLEIVRINNVQNVPLEGA